MYEYLFKAFICFCFCKHVLCDAECSQVVLGARKTFPVSEGGRLTLSCLVQHCETTWTGRWSKSTNVSLFTLEENEKYQFTSVKLKTNETRLELKLVSVDLSDSGSYRCEVTWDGGSSGVGHWMVVNVTKVIPVQRNVLHRVLVCAGALLCLPVILGLACCLSSKVKPQPHPRVQETYAAVQKDRSHLPPQPCPRRPVPKKRTTSPHIASPSSQQKIEIVYADISQDALRQQSVKKEPVQPTVYSSVKFSRLN